MASTIAAVTTGGGGVITTADSSGNLSLLSGATTVVAVTSAGVAVTGTMAVSGTSAFTGAVTLTGGLNAALAVTSGGTGVTTSTGTGAGVHSVGPSISSAVMTTMASSVITSGTTVATTSGTSVDLTGIPSWVKRITVMFNEISLNSSVLILIQLGKSAGVETSGYLGGASSSGSVVASTAGIVANQRQDSGSTYSGSVTLTLIEASTNTWIATGASNYSTDRSYPSTICCIKPLAGTIDRVRFTSSSGTAAFDAGSINILYD